MPTKAAPAKKAPATKTKKAASRPMSDDHKAALAAGRQSGRAVRAYLEALETHKPKRGRKRTPESVSKRLEAIETEMGTVDPVKRLSLVQEQFDLYAELAGMNVTVDMDALEKDFIANAKAYSESKGISYAAWRAIGVAPDVLKAAGISRAS